MTLNGKLPSPGGPISKSQQIYAPRHGKQREFLSFILDHCIDQGVEELDENKLPQLIALRYQTVSDAVAELGQVSEIRETFVGFQKHLYEGNPVA